MSQLLNDGTKPPCSGKNGTQNSFANCTLRIGVDCGGLSKANGIRSKISIVICAFGLCNSEPSG